MAMNQTRYFAMALARNSVVTMTAGVFLSSTYSTELCLTCAVTFESKILQQLALIKKNWTIRCKKVYEWEHPTTSFQEIVRLTSKHSR